jgi:hypothetical protein
MDGTDGSAVFTDEIGKSWSANGNAQLDTAEKKIGTASGLFDGTGDYIDTPDHADFDVGSGDFTIDFWMKRAAVVADLQFFCGQIDSTAAANADHSFRAYLNASNVKFGICQSATVTDAASTGTIGDTNWHHIACVRDGNTLRIFIDGTADGTADVTGKTANNSSKKMAVGRLGEYDGYYFNGWIDEFRFSKGIARWTAGFTPQTTAYADGYNTSGVYTHHEQDISVAGVAGTATITFNTTITSNTTLTMEVNLYTASATGSWTSITSGSTLIAEGTDLTGYKMKWRASLATTDTSVTPYLNDVTVEIAPVTEITNIGSKLNIFQPGNEAWGNAQYSTYTSGGTASAWTAFDPISGSVTVPYPGYTRVKADEDVIIYNSKTQFTDSDVICGFVEVS